MRSSRLALPLFVGAVVASSLVFAENWPQWRGPLFNGSTTETGLPTTWSTTEGVAWVTPMPGPSAATPAVWGDRVFVSSVDAQSKGLVGICISVKDGKVLWQKQVGKDRPALVGGNNMACPSPIADGQRVFFYYGTGDLAAFDCDGNPLWSRTLDKDLGEFIVKYGYSSSPLLYKGKLYVVLLQNSSPGKYRASNRTGPLSSYLIALDPATGKDLWRHVRRSEATDESLEAYITPVPYEGQGRSQVVVVGGDCLTGHNPDDGEEVWRWSYNRQHGNMQRLVPSAVPGDGLIYFAEPRGKPLHAIRPDGTGALTDAHVAWTFKGTTTDAATPLYYKGRVYLLDGDRRVMHCLDAKTGEVKWQGQLGQGPVLRGSPTGADGRVYCINEAGQVIVLAAGDELKVVARIPMGEGPCRSSMAVAAGRLFIRTAKNLYCIGGKRQ
jgi:outer membrane protein assembly factor BamB